jgi:quercetin dioxygenase-like cupin family protein
MPICEYREVTQGEANERRPAAALHADAGKALWWTPAMLRVEKLTSADTGGAFAISEVRVEPHYASPPHVHHREDETVYVLEGTLTALVNGELVEGGAGTTFFFPRESHHSWIVGADGARLLVVLCPGGFERFYSEHGTPAEPGATPAPPSIGREDVARIMRDEYGIELVPPPPGYPETNV